MVGTDFRAAQAGEEAFRLIGAYILIGKRDGVVNPAGIEQCWVKTGTEEKCDAERNSHPNHDLARISNSLPASISGTG